jgi:hypothetical protein
MTASPSTDVQFLKDGQLRRVRKLVGDTIADQTINNEGGNP